ncbi:transposase (fragment) [Candidatus Terasakiella magnetica]
MSVAVAEGVRGGEVCELGRFPNRADAIAKLEGRRTKGGQRLNFCYESGPCGYGLHRQISALGHDCMVAAPDTEGRPT